MADSDEPVVLGGRLASLGCTIAFIDRSCDEVLSEIKEIRRDHDVALIGPEAFDVAVARLDPMEAPWTMEVVVNCGEWTGYLNNFVNGGDPSAIAPALARCLGATCVTAVHMPRYGPVHAVTQFLLDGPGGQPPLMGMRSLAAHCQDGRWSWYESETRQPFERPERYDGRLKRDRLDRPLLVDYMAAFGIAVDDPSYFGAAWVVQQIVDWPVRRESVDHFRQQNGWTQATSSGLGWSRRGERVLTRASVGSQGGYLRSVLSEAAFAGATRAFLDAGCRSSAIAVRLQDRVGGSSVGECERRCHIPRTCRMP